jgi:hypothetical protein
MEQEENMKYFVSKNEKACQKLHVKDNDLNYLKKDLDNVTKHVV